MLTIREANTNDIDLIAELAHDIWPHTFAGILSAEQLAYMLDLMYSHKALQEHFTKPHMHYYIAEWQGQAKGFLCVQHHLSEQKTKLHRIYILPQTQGMGIGAALMKHAEAVCLAAGDKALYLNVNRYNKALTFYEHLGYEIVKTEDIDIGNGYLMEDYVLEKRSLA